METTINCQRSNMNTNTNMNMNMNMCEHTPDTEYLPLNNTAQSTTEEKAEASISTVDSEFGCTTDQEEEEERMYRRFIGLEGYLLTRKGEIEIRKRIEGGLMDMMAAISASPAAVAEILVMANEVSSGKVNIWDVVDSFVDDESDYYALEADMAFSRFEAIAAEFERLHQAHAADGYGSPDYQRVQQALTQKVLTIRFTTKVIKILRNTLHAQMIDARKKVQDLRCIPVDKCDMPKRPAKFLPNLLDRKLIEQQEVDKSWNLALEFSIPSVQELQQYLIDPQKKVVVPLDELKYINKRINDGGRAIRNARKELFEAIQPLVIFMAKKFINKGLSLNELIEVCNRPLRYSINRLAYYKSHRKKFSGIITWSMREAMIEAIYNKTRDKRQHAEV